MTYRSLLLHLDHDPHCTARTQVAIRLAKKLDCHLAGVAPTGFMDVPASPQDSISLTEFAAVAWRTLRDQAEQATQRFREECRTAGLKSFEAVIDEEDKATSLVRHAHCSDLTILSQADPGATGHELAQDVVEQVVLFSARPTLILPHTYRNAAGGSIGTHAMVAWDDSREAARALSDALPLLRLAKRVQVVNWHKARANSDQTWHTRLDALHQWLMWQGVPADVCVETSDINITDTMLSRAAKLKSDLIVMGAYGHARWNERMLGGATRGMLTSMTVPVLMSH
ncbi:MAG: universal stress protein [Burkholderiales bacterium]|nr:universal stress protein [Burkholderiales bacterium]